MPTENLFIGVCLRIDCQPLLITLIFLPCLDAFNRKGVHSFVDEHSETITLRISQAQRMFPSLHRGDDRQEELVESRVDVAADILGRTSMRSNPWLLPVVCIDILEPVHEYVGVRFRQNGGNALS